MQILIFGQNGWIGHKMGQLCAAKALPYAFAKSRLENREDVARFVFVLACVVLLRSPARILADDVTNEKKNNKQIAANWTRSSPPLCSTQLVW